MKYYADDTNVGCAGTSTADVQQKLQLTIDTASDWISNNRLVLNPQKSTTMLVGTRQKITMYKSLSDSATTSLQNLFSYVNKDHSYNTRSNVNGVLIAPRCNLEIFTQSLSYSGPPLSME